jgi:hypothetical protein
MKTRVAGCRRPVRRLLDNTRQVLRVPNRPRANDRSRYLSRPPLFAEVMQQAGELPLARGIDQVRRRHAMASVHAHVERAGSGQGKTPFRICQLMAAGAEIGQQAIGPSDAKRGERGPQF